MSSQFATAAERLTYHLSAARAMREAHHRAVDQRALQALKSWQAGRLARTHADLAASERYAPAIAFFLTELYAAKDFTARDTELARVVPVMVRFLPEKALDTLADAAHMDALSESLDAAMSRAIVADIGNADIDGAAYGRAWRTVGQADARELQVALVGKIGAALDHLTRVPLIGATLRMMRRPAHMAGLANLQHFLESGFADFRHMGRADEFLERILARESDYMTRLFEGADG